MKRVVVVATFICAAVPSAVQAQRPGVAAQLPPNAPPAVQACVGCHGAQGEGNPEAGSPRLAAQSQRYLLKQLDSYAGGTRRSRVMEPIARSLPPEVRADVARYYATLEVRVAGPRENARPPARGAVLANRGDNALGVPACRNCHGPGGVGEPPNIPYIAGLHAEYIVHELRAWKQGTRTNDAGQQMFTVATALPDADMEAVARYYASLPPPKPAPLDLVQAPTPTGASGSAATQAAGEPQSEAQTPPARREGSIGVDQGGAGATTGGTQGAGGTSEPTNIKDDDTARNGGGSEPPGDAVKRKPSTGPQWPAIIEERNTELPSSAPAAPGDPARGRALVASGAYGCPACHAIPGIRSARGVVGPPLDGVGTRAFIAGRLPNDVQTLAAFVFNAPALVPETGMPKVGLTFAEARHVAAFLHTLDAPDAR